MLKNIIFDFGGVLCEWEPLKLMATYFPNEDVEYLYSVIFHNWAVVDGGTMDYDDYLKETLTMLPEKFHDGTRAFFQTYYKRMPPLEDTWALIGRLKARGYRLYLLSNAVMPFVKDCCDLIPLLKAFDGLVISAPIQLLKPDAAIYEYLLNQYNLVAEESIFIDDLIENVEGARRCGIHGYHFHNDADALLKTIEALS